MLVDYCLEMERNYYGFTLADPKRIVCQLSIRNNLPCPFSTGIVRAGQKWQCLGSGVHLRKHSEVYFTYKPDIQKVYSHPSRMFNVGETDISIVQLKATKILQLKEKPIQNMASAERVVTVTAICCMFATDCSSVPHVNTVWPRVKYTESWQHCITRRACVHVFRQTAVLFPMLIQYGLE
ncbi:hypothetical protein PR048_020358 [Dryococelus australis]|uniref:Uncharacterized protein n=1 Tax=Dryococelus australis TaxID=614101 RepID=A0ABQ9H629_9NEOP|nr:hypothetical protein PR048_020358 [Dryococelus australis]